MERGTLVRWNDEKGFGFIKPEAGNGKDVFIHISALKHMARKPMVGDAIQYLTEQQADGKVKAIKASIEGVAVVASTSKRSAPTSHHRSSHNSYSHTSNSHNSKSHNRHSRQSKSSSVMLIPLVVILALGIFGFKRYEALTAQSNTPVKVTNELSQQPATEQIKWTQPKETFRCEAGKQHCSQMRSCAEAKYYQRNCPGTKMDGDSDGIPCERQHCGH
ncbi:cold-shock DNA-binding domain protein [Shewanella sediminis HAW-EB3]|uniref:Cold-shock DNA-binding domain protein n=1 Tax=Shewanella sediminis (strain HAW-EB3) TaxID=425104 RepID=A8FQY6_SHESH|nr:excalibur calcium-binding domain-containing protein [Shewanella sediminis]ABV35259.1 cold-shock DNA-binding domain protein [Shewanella sediminis HAW-EB3]